MSLKDQRRGGLGAGSPWLRTRPANVGTKRRRQYPAIGQCAEEPLPTGTAPVSRKSQPALQGEKRALFHTLPRDGLQIKISALGAVGIPREPKGHATRIKSPLAGVASPRLQTNEPRNQVQNSIPVRAKAISASAVRTNHFPNFPLVACAAAYWKGPVRARLTCGRLPRHPV
jgi:hypothetical protein